MKNKTSITKRIMSLLMSTLMVCSLFSGVVMVSAEETAKQYGVLFSENFDGAHSTTQENTYYNIYGMRSDRQVGQTARLTESDCSAVPGLGANSLSLNDNNSTRVWKQWSERTYVYSGDDSTYSFEQEGTNTNVITEFDMYVHSGSLNAGSVKLMDGNVYGGSTENEFSKKRLLELKFDPTTKKISYYTLNTNSYTEIGTFTLDAWNRYRIVQKVTDSENALGTFDLYIDGVKVLSDVKYTKDGSAYSEYAYDMISFETSGGGSTNSANLAYTFDNINVYKYSDNDTSVVAAPDAGKLISALRKYNSVVSTLGYATSCEPSKADLEAKLAEGSDLYDITSTGTFEEDGYQDLFDVYVEELEEMFAGLTVTYKTGGEQINIEGTSLIGTGNDFDTAYNTGDIKYVGGEITNGNTPLGAGRYVIGDTATTATIEGISISTDETSDYYYKKEGPNASLVIDFDFKSKDLVANQRPAYVSFGDGKTIALDTSSLVYTVGFGMRFDGSAQQIVFSGSDSVYSNFKDGEWYNIRYVVKVTDENGDFAGKFDAYVNGTKIVSDGSINTASSAKIDSMLVKDLSKSTQRKTNTSIVYYDNIRIYKSNVSASMPIYDGKLLSAIRAAEIEYAAMDDSDASKATLAAAIETAKTAFEATGRTEASLESAYEALINWDGGSEEDPEEPVVPDNSPVFTIDGIVFTDASKNEVDSIVSKGKVSKIKVTKNKEWDKDAKLVVAFFQNNKFANMRVYNVPASLTVGEQTLINSGWSIYSNIEGFSIKVFIWDDLTTIIPRADVYSVSAGDSSNVATVDLSTVPLYESISVYVEQSVPVDKCEVYYRKTSDLSWSQAYSAEYNHRESNYSTSIVDLEEDTEYEVRVELYDEGNNIVTASTTTTTMTSNPPIAQEISIKDIYTPGLKRPLDLTGYSGSPDGWIKIKGDGETVVDVTGYNYTEAVLCDNTHYVILEDLIITGGKRYGVNIKDTCSNIRLVGCDVSEWALLGELKETSESTAEKVKVAYFDTTGIQVRGAAINVYCDDVTIERCFIHDGNAKVNPWYGTDAKTGLAWQQAHPEGPHGIVLNGSRVVVRYNDIVGSEHFRFNDCIASGNNFGPGGLTADCDVYGNMLSLANDDGVELDGNAKNVRFHHNRIFATYTGISTVDNYTGPSFVFNNVLHDLRDSSNMGFYHTKNAIDNKVGDPDTTLFGITHFFYNTFYTNKGESFCGIYAIGSNNKPFHAITRNNIVLGGQSSKQQIKNIEDANSKSSFDYDLVGNYGTTDGKGNITLPTSYTNGREENAILGLPTFTNKDGRDFRLTADSLGYNSACKVNGFEGKNMGALDIGSNGLIPTRPLDMTFSESFIELKQSGSDTFNLTSNEDVTMSFNIVMNEKNSPFTVTCEKSSIAPGETLTFTVVADESVELNVDYDDSRYYYYDGIAFIKFSNGHSLPICLRIKEYIS